MIGTFPVEKEKEKKPAVRVRLYDHNKAKTKQVDIDPNASVKRLIPKLVPILGNSLTDVQGRRIRYNVAYNGRRLQEDETLASVGVQPGEALTLVPEMTAGA